MAMSLQDRGLDLLQRIEEYINQQNGYETDGHALYTMPFSMTVGGRSSCGKTYFVKELLKDLKEGEGYSLHTVIFYGTDQSMYDEMNIDEKYEGLDRFVEVVSKLEQHDVSGKGEKVDLQSKQRIQPVIIIDDLMTEVIKHPDVCNKITRGISHEGLTMILIYQNLLPQAKYARNIAMNVHYKVCFYNSTSARQFQYVVMEMDSGKKTLIDMYRKLGAEGLRGPLVIDCLKHLAWYGVRPDSVISLHDKP